MNLAHRHLPNDDLPVDGVERGFKAIHSLVNMDLAALKSFLSIDDSIAQQQPTT